MKTYSLNAKKPLQVISDNHPAWRCTSKTGNTLSCNNYFYQLNGEPFFILAGEIHPTRTREEYWEESILRMKAGGLNTVSFYILWLHIEERPGQFNFEGNRNIRRFIELCHKHGMFAWPRIGPFCNAEVAHGGLPTWLYGMPVRERSNDPNYLYYVERLYRELGKQFEGLYFKDDGPIIGIQIENEYGHAPALWSSVFPFGGSELVSTGTDGDSHMLKLKDLAVKSGMIVPFYTATGWAGAACPKEEFIPTCGAYCYLSNNGPTAGSTFSIEPRCFETPLTSCELGTGGATQKGWRPLVPPESNEVVLFNSLACGSNAAGFYMYHGGTNPTNYDRFYVSDSKYLCMDLMCYDFFAPLGEFGLVRDSYYHLRPLMQFVKDFEKEFIPTCPVWQEVYVGPENTEDLRYMARVSGNRGYLFINNYQDKLQLPRRSGLHFTIELPSESLSFPLQDSLTIAENEMALLPFHMDLNGTDLIYSLAQPMCRVEAEGRLHYVFMALEETAPEFAFKKEDIISYEGCAGKETDGILLLSPLADHIVNIKGKQGSFALLILGKQTARHTLKTRLKGQDRLLCSESVLTVTDDAVTLTDRTSSRMELKIFPALAHPLSAGFSQAAAGTDGFWQTFVYDAEPREIQPVVTRYDADKILVSLPEYQFEGLNDIYMAVEFNGDMARVFSDGLLVADSYNRGIPWLIGLKRLKKEVTGHGLYLKLLPWNEKSVQMVFDGITFKPISEQNENGAALKSLTFCPEYKILLQ